MELWKKCAECDELIGLEKWTNRALKCEECKVAHRRKRALEYRRNRVSEEPCEQCGGAKSLYNKRFCTIDCSTAFLTEMRDPWKSVLSSLERAIKARDLELIKPLEEVLEDYSSRV